VSSWGSFAALSVIVAVASLLARRVPRAAIASRLAFGALVAAGLVAAGVVSFPSGELRQGDESLASTSCREAPYEPPAPLMGGHPDKSFYAPGEDFSGADLLHVMHDGYVIVGYGEDLPASERRELGAWVLAGELAVIAIASDEQTKPIHALTKARQLTCSKLELATLTDFHDRWFETLRG